MVALAAKQRYLAVSARTGVPWFVIAVIHERKCSLTHGLQVVSAVDTMLVGCKASGKSTGTSGVSHGIIFNGGNSGIRIIGLQSKAMTGFANSQSNGLVIGAGCDSITILGCDLTTNSNGLTFSATPTFCRVLNNQGVGADDRDEKGPFRGTYTPTTSTGSNISAATTYTNSWSRVGDMVTVFGRIDLTAPSAATCSLNLSLPSTTTMTATEDCIGTAAIDAGVNAGRIYKGPQPARPAYPSLRRAPPPSAWLITSLIGSNNINRRPLLWRSQVPSEVQIWRAKLD
jgi:hypothetical protein